MLEPETITLDSQPHKRYLLNQARSYSPDLALFEFIDNAVDVWKRNDKPNDLVVTLQFEFREGLCKSITVTDNGGGVPRDRLQALVQVGAENPHEGGIGVWGSGLKIGAIALATHWTINTRSKGDHPWTIDWPASWWEQKTWEPLKAVQLPDDAMDPGMFCIRLQEMQKPPLTRQEVFGGEGNPDPILKRLGRVYAPLLSKAGDSVTVLLQDGDAEPIAVEPDIFGDPARFDELFAYPPGFEPRRYQIHLDRTKGLELELIVGILPEQSRDLSGVSMYGQGRLFVQALKEGTVGFGTRGQAKIPASHPTTWRLAVLAYFDGPPILIPWGSPAKQGYKETNPYQKEIRQAIMEAALPYATFTRVAKRLDVLPYSAKWRDLSEDARRLEVQRFARDKKTADEIVDANPHLLHAVRRGAPISERTENLELLRRVTSVHLKTAQNAVAFLRKRDPKSVEGIWSPQGVQFVEEHPREPEFADPWAKSRTVLLSIPVPTAELIEREATTGLKEWLLATIDAAASRLDPLWLVPQQEFRPVVEQLRSMILEAHPDVERIAVFGSVARGEADRKSDIDLLVVHPDRLRVQMSLQARFKDYRYPPGGDRYAIQVLVSKASNLTAHAKGGSADFQAMMEDAFWIHGRQNGGKNDVQQ